MSDRERIKDFIVLGRSGPSYMSDSRHTVCVGGYSPSRESFIRIYPTKVYNDKLKRWKVVDLEVINNPSDHRSESFKMPESKEKWDEIHEKMTVVDKIEDKKEKMELIREIKDDSIKDIEAEERSMGLIEPDISKAYLEERKNKETIQKDLHGMELRSKQTFKYIPRVKFRCKPNCQIKTYHKPQLLEWGIYEFWRRHCGKDGDYEYEEFADATDLKNPEYEHYFLVGDAKSNPYSFMVISDVRMKSQDQNSKNRGLDEY